MYPFRSGIGREVAAYHYLSKLGYEVYKRGWPDLLAYHPSKDEIRFIEVKALSDNLKPQQQYMKDIFGKCGLNYEIARISQADGDYFVDTIG